MPLSQARHLPVPNMFLFLLLVFLPSWNITIKYSKWWRLISYRDSLFKWAFSGISLITVLFYSIRVDCKVSFFFSSRPQPNCLSAIYDTQKLHINHSVFSESFLAIVIFIFFFMMLFIARLMLWGKQGCTEKQKTFLVGSSWERMIKRMELMREWLGKIISRTSWCAVKGQKIQC